VADCWWTVSRRTALGVLAFTKMLRVSGEEYQLELIDTSGQDELSIVSQSHSMNLDGYVLVYSVTSEKRFLPHSPENK